MSKCASLPVAVCICLEAASVWSRPPAFIDWLCWRNAARSSISHINIFAIGGVRLAGWRCESGGQPRLSLSSSCMWVGCCLERLHSTSSSPPPGLLLLLVLLLVLRVMSCLRAPSSSSIGRVELRQGW